MALDLDKEWFVQGSCPFHSMMYYKLYSLLGQTIHPPEPSQSFILRVVTSIYVGIIIVNRQLFMLLVPGDIILNKSVEIKG